MSATSQTQNWLNSILSVFNPPLTEITISPETSSNGSIDWHVYDPQTEQLIKFDTEADMLSWLDGKHY